MQYFIVYQLKVLHYRVNNNNIQHRNFIFMLFSLSQVFLLPKNNTKKVFEKLKTDSSGCIQRLSFTTDIMSVLSTPLSFLICTNGNIVYIHNKSPLYYSHFQRAACVLSFAHIFFSFCIQLDGRVQPTSATLAYEKFTFVFRARALSLLCIS